MATLGSFPSAGLGLSPRISPRIDSSLARAARQPVVTRGGFQYMSKHFAHPEGLPLMLSLGVGLGCYLGLEAMGKHNPPAEQTARTLPESRGNWKVKDYRLGLTEESVGEVLFSVGM
ncbi:hypothetical protein BDV93DRAFT_525790 [Ceratobasidium sp. AG-I]|nr:hypothetical protein BDV93DRAFT_525790 [Ceratobasidium sp. AG-I]